MEILFQDEHFIAINKPSGYHVHPPEDRRIKVARDHICLYLVRNLLGQHVYPVHRLDAATSGILLFALSSAAASKICPLFAEGKVEKTYQAIVRGWTAEEGRIDLPLESDSTGTLLDSSTLFVRRGKIELNAIVGTRNPTARYSWVEVYPQTGRYHQIRRHFNRISHPLVGDSYHGDSRHNGFFKKELGIFGLCLKAEKLKITHPWTGQEVLLTAPPCEKWSKIQELFASEAQRA